MGLEDRTSAESPAHRGARPHPRALRSSSASASRSATSTGRCSPSAPSASVPPGRSRP